MVNKGMKTMQALVKRYNNAGRGFSVQLFDKAYRGGRYILRITNTETGETTPYIDVYLGSGHVSHKTITVHFDIWKRTGRCDDELQELCALYSQIDP